MRLREKRVLVLRIIPEKNLNTKISKGFSMTLDQMLLHINIYRRKLLKSIK